MGDPVESPTLVVDDAGVHVSWNGATEVVQWRLLTGDDEAGATKERVVDKDGFETLIPVSPDAAFIAVSSRDVSGNVIGSGLVPTD